MGEGRSKLARKQEIAIAALLVARNHAEAAATAGIAPSTLQRWLHLPEFQEAYRTARRTAVEAALAQLQRGTAEAVAALERNLNCGHPPSEIRAALGYLEHALKALETFDLEARLAALENQGKEGGTE